MNAQNVCQKIAGAPSFERFVLGAIVVAGALVGFETSESVVAEYGSLLHLLDKVILGIFAAEIVIKLVAEGPRPWRYFLDPWNIFDFVIVAVCFLPLDSRFASVMRLVRVLRALRLVKALPQLRLLVNALIKSFSSMFYVGMLLFLVFYIFGTLSVFIFGKLDPEHFGTLPQAFLTLFQVVTLEGWADIMRPLMEHLPLGAPVFFVTFILLGTMIVLNLFIGVIVSGMSESQEELAAMNAAQTTAPAVPPLADELRDWREKMAALEVDWRRIRERMEKELPS